MEYRARNIPDQTESLVRIEYASSEAKRHKPHKRRRTGGGKGKNKSRELGIGPTKHSTIVNS